MASLVPAATDGLPSLRSRAACVISHTFNDGLSFTSVVDLAEATLDGNQGRRGT